jgi:pyridoxal phosphate enzyme (YggS family)
MSLVRENLDRLKGNIEKACARSSRRSEDVAIVAVTKTVPVGPIQEAVEAGIRLLGENRVQEAAAKVEKVGGDVIWHMVGHLQRNKVRKAVTMFDMIQSVDSRELALEIDRRCEQAGRTMDVLVEVNTSGEKTKFGTDPEETIDLVEEISHLNNIDVRGLMTIGAFTDDEARIRACFRTLRELAGRVSTSGIEDVRVDFLSMGMTSDYEVAIEEGSNMVRIGTAIFGPRHCGEA